MKITLDIDISPAEFREVMGWPDVSELQREGMGKILELMHQGADGYDPLSLMQPFFASSMNSMETLQKLMLRGLQGYSQGADTEPKTKD
ncbi:MAG: hypothetical protein ACFCUG_12315 [Thiotrichales bacterium]